MGTRGYVLGILCLLSMIMERGNSTSVLRRSRRSTYQNMECAAEIRKNGMSLLNAGINKIDSSIKITGRFYYALEDIYKYNNRLRIFNVTKQGLEHISTSKYAVPHFDNVSLPFEAKYVYLYTTKSVYSLLNRSLREHDCTHKVLSDEEKAIAPFSAGLMAVLMYWPALEKDSGLTYRKIILDETYINSYKNGITFVWNQFVSTTRRRSRAFDGNIEFITNNENNGDSIFSPRRVQKYAWDQSLDEVIYCPGAEFMVTGKSFDKSKNITIIQLKYLPFSSSPKKGTTSADPSTGIRHCAGTAVHVLFPFIVVLFRK